MVFTGLKKQKERDDLIAYLKDSTGKKQTQNIIN